MPNEELAQALAGSGPPQPGSPQQMPMPQGGMPPQQAMQILQQLGITPQNLPIVIQAIQAVMGGGAGGPPSPPPMMPGPMNGPMNGPPRG